MSGTEVKVENVLGQGGATFEPKYVEHPRTFAYIADCGLFYDLLLFGSEELRDSWVCPVQNVNLMPVGVDLEPITYKRIVVDGTGKKHMDCEKDCDYILHQKPIRKITRL